MDNNVKKQLLDLLEEDPTMVLSTAYVYAKNYVKDGEDNTKAWINTAQQLSVIQEVRQQAFAAAYDSLKAVYDERLKDDMVAMLEEIHAEIEELKNEPACCLHFVRGIHRSSEVVQQEIDKLKEDKK